jgi:MerR family transcriptional regulator, redox-sensitive transcriptional activator SoxR
MRASRDAELTIGELAERSGVATSALRFYEAEGLIASRRTDGNQRRFARATLRRVALIQAGRAAGVTLEEIRSAIDALPHDRPATKRDWERLSRAWRRDVDERIARLEALRDQLTSCIGCGCLSLRSCALFNARDRASRLGPGARYLLGDDPGRMVDR